ATSSLGNFPLRTCMPPYIVFFSLIRMRLSWYGN
ncbi:hypothetical protein ACJX0J_042081, partial [Zea mays]